MEKYRTDPEYRTDPNVEKYRTDPEYRTDPNVEKYKTDPNMEKYRTDPNVEKYRTDPDMEKYRTDPKYSTTYMEIPHRDSAPPERDKNTPARSLSSSLSKDSLFSDAGKKTTPDTPGERAVKAVAGGDDPGHPDPVGLAFTVDFSDDKKLNMAGSLSEFVPSKIRKNFRERMEKVAKPQSREGNHSKVEVSREFRGF